VVGRSEARRFALRSLFLVDQNPDADQDRIQAQLRKEFTAPALREFAWQLISGVLADRAALDARIRQSSSNWRLERMAVTDRNVLRMSLYEMQRMGTPAAVVIDEAVEIAREYGTENSGGFVNGILDQLKPAPAAEPRLPESPLAEPAAE
jgi:N utilization substance protein B